MAALLHSEVPLVLGPDIPRDMSPGEADEVDALLRAAFPGPEEAGLVRDLRASGRMVAEMVTLWQGRIAAYAAVSRMVAPKGWLCLAPVAVWPAWQGGVRGAGHPVAETVHFGTALVTMLVGRFSSDNADPIPTLVVLGKPAFYARCGFSQERAARLTGPYPIHHTLIARAGSDIPEDTLIYPAAFDGL